MTNAIKFFPSAIRVITLGLLTFSVAYAEDDEVLNPYLAKGVVSEREIVSHDDVENIDPFTGVLQRSYIDMVVPGQGLDIVIQRSYSSNASQDGALQLKRGVMPQGWDLHFGRIRIRDGAIIPTSCTSGLPDHTTAENPVLELPDGSKQVMLIPALGTHSSADFITENNWKAKCLAPSEQINSGGGLAVYAPDGTRYLFNKKELIEFQVYAYYPTEIRDTSGNKLEFEYLESSTGIKFGAVKKITANDGRSVSFDYQDFGGETGHILKSISSSGRTVNYTAITEQNDASNYYKLDKVTLPDNSRWQYTYYSTQHLAKGSMETALAPLKALAKYSYDHENFVGNDTQPAVVKKELYKKSDSSSNLLGTWVYEYSQSSLGDTTLVKGPYHCIEYGHVGYKSYTPATTSALWSIGTLKSKKVFGDTSCADENTVLRNENYAWEKFLVSNQRRASVGKNEQEYYKPYLKKKTVDDSYVTETLSVDGYGRPTVISETGESGRQFSYVYQNDTNLWVIDNFTSEIVHRIGDSSDKAQEKRTYRTSDGLMSSKTIFKDNEVNGATTAYQYSSGQLSKITDPLGNEISYSNYYRGIPQTESHEEGIGITRTVDSFGNIKSETNGLGHITSFEYDDLNRLTKIDLPESDSLNTIIGWSYPSSGGLKRTESRGSYTKVTTYDVLGHVVEETEGGIKRVYDHDVLGRLTFKSHPGSVILGREYEYDALGRMTKAIDSENYIQTWDFQSGNKVSYTDRVGNITTYHYTSFGDPDEKQLIKVVSEEGQTTEIERNILGKITKIKQGGKERTYSYDNLYHLSSEAHPEVVGSINYSFDANGNMQSRTVGSATANYSYDGRNRLKSISYPVSSLNVSYAYDMADQVTEASKGDFRWEYTYDKNGNRTQEKLTQISSNSSFDMQYGYNNQDYLKEIVYPGNYAVAYNPDSLGRPTQAGNYADTVSYHPNGQLSSYFGGNDIQISVSLNDRQLPHQLNVSKGYDSLLSLDYSYDGELNITGINDIVNPSLNRSFTYDGLNRLKQANGQWGSYSYSYNLLGDLTQRVGNNSVVYSYNNPSNRLESVSGAQALNFLYDDAGNVIQNGEHVFEYADDYSLIKIDNGNINYQYDAHNHRTLSEKGSESTLSMYSQSGQLLYELKSNGDSTKYIYLRDSLIARVDDCVADSDSDTIPDCYEIRSGLNPNSSIDAGQDYDNDGLINKVEYSVGTLVNSSDTDGDGVPDGYEVRNGLNPVVDDAYADLDNDGLSNLAEYQKGTAANNSDTDGDGIPDNIDSEPLGSLAALLIPAYFILLN